MEILVNWQNKTISPSEASEIERNIKSEASELLEDEAKPCHSGDVILTLNAENQFSMSVAGNIKCSCGKPLVIISGNTSSMSYERANA